MNREIKSRAWNKREKKMYQADFFNEFIVINQGKVGSVTGDIQDDSSSFYIDYSRSDDWEVMQYTGLKDKNGKEIYEGDILKYHNGRHSHPIEFPKDYMWLATRMESDEVASAVEIIGNIYENPELLHKGDVNKH
jgi:uncharacterized phage protein (TIGR01671 family)